MDAECIYHTNVSNLIMTEIASIAAAAAAAAAILRSTCDKFLLAACTAHRPSYIHPHMLSSDLHGKPLYFYT